MNIEQITNNHLDKQDELADLVEGFKKKYEATEVLDGRPCQKCKTSESVFDYEDDLWCDDCVIEIANEYYKNQE